MPEGGDVCAEKYVLRMSKILRDCVEGTGNGGDKVDDIRDISYRTVA
jgi:hypothetical protein